MASDYPGAIDALVNPLAGDMENVVSHSGQHTDANDAIEAIEATLGVDPQGAAADVAERLDDIEAAMGGGGGGSYLPLSGGVLTGELDVVSPTATPSAGARQIHYGTAPPGPSDGADGDLWINDGSVTPTAQPGLVCIASQAFTAASAVNVNNVFSALYDNYRIIIDTTTGTAGQDNRLRLRVAGADNSTASSYLTQALVVSNTSVSGLRLTGDYWRCGNSQAGLRCSTIVEILSPAVAAQTACQVFCQAAGSALYNEGGYHTAATAFDGFTIYPVSGTITGTVTVYGYRKAA